MLGVDHRAKMRVMCSLFAINVLFSFGQLRFGQLACPPHWRMALSGLLGPNVVLVSKVHIN